MLIFNYIYYILLGISLSDKSDIIIKKQQEKMRWRLLSGV